MSKPRAVVSRMPDGWNVDIVILNTDQTVDKYLKTIGTFIYEWKADEVAQKWNETNR